MKRNSSDTVITYVIMETKEDNSIYVDFMPQLWIVPMRKNVVLKERSFVNFFFPRRLQQQTKDSYIKFLKQAKFAGAVPDRSDKWDIKAGRILKMNLGSIEEALESQKFFSDYFSTTEAEAVVQTPAPAPKKTVRKKKCVAPKKAETSESDDDDEGLLQVSNYNTRFAADKQLSQSSFNGPVEQNGAHLNLDQFINLGTFEPGNDQFCELQQSIDNILSGGLSGGLTGGLIGGDLANLSDLTNGMVVIDVPTTNVTEQTDNSYVDDQLTIVQDRGDQQTDCPQINNCKCHQKVLNKIDYLHKKLSKELSAVRQENSSNRQLLLQVLDKLGSKVETEEKSDDEMKDVDGEIVHLDMSEVDRFNKKFNETFPIQCSEYIYEFNKSLKDDKSFTDQLYKKLSTIKGEDEAKTMRKIMKVVCGVRCLKDFTWQGTKKMKSFLSLHLLIELLIKTLKTNYPQCDAMTIISKVVKQRTKSAKETWAGMVTATEVKEKEDEADEKKDEADEKKDEAKKNEEAKKNGTSEYDSTTKDLISTDLTGNITTADNTKVAECSSPDDDFNQQISE